MITVQVGKYSNFVGAQLFNLQNPETLSTSVPSSPNILWREVPQRTHPLFSPRVLIIDTKEHSIQTSNASSGPPSSKTIRSSLEESNLWGGKIEQIGDDEEAAPVEPVTVPSSANAIAVNYSSWADVIRWRLSSDQVQLLPNFTHSPESGALSTYSQGLEVWKEIEEGSEDCMRKYAEECDRLQGFNVFVDQLDGFSGIAGGLLQYLSDEYDKKLVLGIGLCPPTLPPPTATATEETKGRDRAFRARIANTTLLWDAFNSYSTVFTGMGLCQDFLRTELLPVTLPYINYKIDSYYESSALLCAALDTLLAPCVTPSAGGSSLSLSELSSFLAAMGRKLTSVSAAIPFPLMNRSGIGGGASFFSSLSSAGLAPLQSLTPGVKVKPELEKCNGNYFAVRGIPEANVISENERKTLPSWQKEMRDARACLELYTREAFPSGVHIVQNYPAPLTLSSASFPTDIIHQEAKRDFSVSTSYAKGVISTWSLPCIASAHNCTGTGLLLDGVVEEALGKRRLTSVTSSLPSANELGMEADDFLDAVNALQSLRSAYRSESNYGMDCE